LALTRLAKSERYGWLRGLRTVFGAAGSDPGDADETPRRTIAIAVCTLISALLWFTFSMQETYSYSIELSTVVRNLPENRALSELPPDKVRVQVQGEGLSLFQLYYNPPVVPIDATLNMVDLEASPPDLPKNLRVESIIPRTYIPRTEPRETKKIPVRLRSTLSTPPTHDFLTPPRVIPDSVEVSGARSTILNLRDWPTVITRRDNVTDSISVFVDLVDTLEGLVRRSVDRVLLVADSREFTGGTRDIDVIVEGSPSSQKLVTLEPSKIRVRYRVLLSDFRKAETAADFFATVRYRLFDVQAYLGRDVVTSVLTVTISGLYLLALALGLPIKFVPVSYAIALGSLVTLLPISISGLGTREATIIAYLSTLGISAEAALGFSLLVFATFYLGGGLMGAAAWWLKPVPLTRLRSKQID